MPLTDPPHQITVRHLTKLPVTYDHTIGWLLLQPVSKEGNPCLNFKPESVTALAMFLHKVLAPTKPSELRLSDTYRAEQRRNGTVTLHLSESKNAYTLAAQTVKELSAFLDEMLTPKDASHATK